MDFKNTVPSSVTDLPRKYSVKRLNGSDDPLSSCVKNYGGGVSMIATVPTPLTLTKLILKGKYIKNKR